MYCNYLKIEPCCYVCEYNNARASYNMPIEGKFDDCWVTYFYFELDKGDIRQNIAHHYSTWIGKNQTQLPYLKRCIEEYYPEYTKFLKNVMLLA